MLKTVNLSKMTPITAQVNQDRNYVTFDLSRRSLKHLGKAGLYDFGAYDTQVNNNTGLFYAPLLGAKTMITRMYAIINGVRVGDTGNYVLRRQVLRNLLKRNQENEDQTRFLSNAGLSLQGNADIDPSFNSLTGDPTLTDYFSTYVDASGDDHPTPQSVYQVSNSKSDGISSFIRLADYMTWLEQLTDLPPIRQFEVVLEYNTLDDDMYQPSDVSNNISNLNLQTKLPTLLVEESNMPLEDQKITIMYESVAENTHHVPATSSGTTQTETWKDDSARGLYVLRSLYWNAVDTGDEWLTPSTISPAMRDQKIQMTIDGEQMIPNDGINTPALQCYLLLDAFGDLNLPYSALLSNLQLESDYPQFDDTTSPLLYNLSLSGLRVNRMVGDMNHRFVRTGTSHARHNQAFDVHTYHFVRNVLVIDKDSAEHVD